MTNTIPSVPRDDLDLIRAVLEGFKPGMARDDALRTVRALLSAPSPAGVDGLEVVAYRTEWTARDAGSKRVSFGSSVPCQDLVRQDYPEAVLGEAEPLCRLSDATAIIDGLRGENERIRLNIAEYNEAIACYQSERDQQAQRIGELEGLLRSCLPALSDGGCAALANRIDAALSAGKEGE